MTLLATGDIVDEPILQASGDAAVGVVTTFGYSSWHNSKENRQFVKDFASVANGFTARPNFVAVAAYDAMTALYHAIDVQKGQLDPDKTIDAVKGFKWMSPRGPVMIDPATRDIVQNVYIRRTQRNRAGTLENIEFDTIPMQKDPNEQ